MPENNKGDALWDYWHEAKNKDGGEESRRTLDNMQDAAPAYLQALAQCPNRKTLVSAVEEAWAMQEPR